MAVPRSRLWTSVLDMKTEHINFPDQAYKNFNGNKDAFNMEKLGSHYEDRENVQVEVIDVHKYITYISTILHKYDDRSMVYAIVHDKDVRYDENGDPIYRNGQQVLDVIPPHLHVLIHFSKAVTLNVVGSLIGIALNELEKGKTRGKYAFSSAMAYLTHALEPKKHQYSVDEVVNGEFNTTVDNENGLYEDFAIAHSDEWSNRRATVEKKRRNLDFDRIYEDTMLGKYTKEDLLGGSDELYKLYVEHKDKLDQARNAYLDRQFIKYNKAVDDGSMKIQTLYVSGRAGHGKTRLAKTVADGLIKCSKGTWRAFQTASDHPFDSYDGEEIIILDDVRANSLNATDWLHLLDPHNSGVTSARYHDAKPMPRLLIITTTSPAHEFFSYAKGMGNDEPIDQFLRRIQWSVNVVDVDKLNIGHNRKLENPRELQLSDRVVSRSESNDRYGKSTRVNYKQGVHKEFNFVFEDWATGSFSDVSDSLINFYATYYGLKNTVDTTLLNSENHVATGSALPIVSDGKKLNISSDDIFRGGIKGNLNEGK